jgi:circadian clock protein KaiC
VRVAPESGRPERVATGIPGLDLLLEGGFLAGGVYLLVGPPGAGKTIFANELCFRHAAKGEGSVFVTLLAESHTRMVGHMRRMHFFDPKAVPDRVYYVSAYKILEDEALPGLLTSVRKLLELRRPKIFVLDGLASLEEFARSGNDYKKFIHELQTITAMMGSTAILLRSSVQGGPFRPEDTLVDGIVELSAELEKLQALRHIRIRKMRGTKEIGGRHTLQISDAGITIWPRIEAQLESSVSVDAPPPGPERCGFGVRGLDELLMGGVPRESTTMLLGPSGSGKTILGLEFLVEGARNGEPGLHFGFYERPQTLIAKSKRIRLGLEEKADDGQVELLWHRPVEGIIDMLGAKLLEAVRRRNVRRLFLDGMHGFQSTSDAADRIRDIFAALAAALQAQGVTTVYTMETPDLYGPQIDIPIGSASQITQNIILLRHVEVGGCICRAVSVVKIREGDYVPKIRELRISDTGVEVVESFSGMEGLLSGGQQMPSKAQKRPRTGSRNKKRGRARKS